jgi:DNA-binding CsgD family transcriptional regulator
MASPTLGGAPRSRASLPATIALSLVIEEALALWRELAAVAANPAHGPATVGDPLRGRARRLVGAAEACLGALGDPDARAARAQPRPALDLPGSGRPDLGAALTPRELDVLRLLAEGRTDREVAATLGVSHRTATTHVTGIFNKLGVTTRTAAVAHAIRAGLV